MSAPLLRGEVVFEEGAHSFTDATLRVSLLDTSLADAPSKTVLSQVVKNVSYDSEHPQKLTFALSGAVPDEDAQYTVRVHLDLNGDGRISRGDYINMQSYPVLTRGRPNVVSVQVKRLA